LSVKILKLDEVEVKSVLGGPIKIMFTPETADTKYLRFSVGYFGPGEGLAAHIHPESEEVYYVISGSGTVYAGEELEPIEVEADTAVYIPPKTTHGVKNTGSEKCVVAFFVAPGKEKSEVV
jgi:mannose-6-phosphate isomerase-like protein (cupin superfamily)